MVIDTSPAGAVVIDPVPADDVASSMLIRLLQGRQLAILAWGG